MGIYYAEYMIELWYLLQCEWGLAKVDLCELDWTIFIHTVDNSRDTDMEKAVL